MKTDFACLCSLLAVIAWLAGTVLAQGFWHTALAVTCAPFAWYLVVEQAMRHVGIV